VTDGALATGHRSPDRLAYWQGLDSGRLLLLSVCGTLVITSFAILAIGNTKVDWPIALSFGAFIAMGELLRLALPGSREAAPIAMVGAMSYALLLTVGRQPPVLQKQLLQIRPELVVAVSAVGMAIGALPHIVANRPGGLTGMCTRLVAVASVAFIFRDAVSKWFVNWPWPRQLGLIAALLVLGWLVDAIVGAVIRADDVRAKFRVAIWDELRLQWALGLAVGAWVIITVFGAEVMGLYELAVFVGPLLVTQVAFRRYAGIRATYLQTVRSLARVTEVAGYVDDGHSRRVSQLAVAIGRGLGMPETELLDLEYAALMHDIGQLSLRDPIPGGATVLVSLPEQQRIAELGAAVIRQAGVLDAVAEIVRCQARPATGHDPAPPLGSMIIRAANAFDDLVGDSTSRERAATALHRLRLDPLTYDSGVVAALAEVVNRRVPPRR